MSSRRLSTRCRSRSGRRAVSRQRTRGVALVTVIWLVALMTLLAGSALTVARVSAKLAANHLAIARAEAIADSGIRRAILSLLEEDYRRRWPLDGTATAFNFHGTTVTVRMTEESGRVDINGADAALLSALLAVNGVELEEARAMAARIVDWRDKNDDLTPGGAESAEYRRESLSYGPRNGPFESVDEAWQVLGITQTLREQLGSSLTVYTGQLGVDPAAAPAQVQAALKWADARQWGERRWLVEGTLNSPQPDREVAGRVIRISAVAQPGPAAKDSPNEPISASREVVVRMTGNLRAPVLVYAWASSSQRRPVDPGHP